MHKQLFRLTESTGLLVLGFGLGVLLFSPQQASAGQTEVKIVTGPVLDPPDITIKAGDSVVWTPKTGGVPHHLAVNPKFPNDVFPDVPNTDQESTFDSGTPASDRTRIFNSPGLIHYICLVHPTKMIGTITVTP
jgi:plastocyanin